MLKISFIPLASRQESQRFYLQRWAYLIQHLWQTYLFVHNGQRVAISMFLVINLNNSWMTPVMFECMHICVCIYVSATCVSSECESQRIHRKVISTIQNILDKLWTSQSIRSNCGWIQIISTPLSHAYIHECEEETEMHGHRTNREWKPGLTAHSLKPFETRRIIAISHFIICLMSTSLHTFIYFMMQQTFTLMTKMFLVHFSRRTIVLFAFVTNVWLLNNPIV